MIYSTIKFVYRPLYTTLCTPWHPQHWWPLQWCMNLKVWCDVPLGRLHHNMGHGSLLWSMCSVMDRLGDRTTPTPAPLLFCAGLLILVPCFPQINDFNFRHYARKDNTKSTDVDLFIWMKLNFYITKWNFIFSLLLLF